MSKADELKQHLQPGQVYRRSDMAKWSKAVDRNMQQLVKQGELQKLSGGVYYCPKTTAFGNVPPEDAVLVRAFLKDDHFYPTTSFEQLAQVFEQFFFGATYTLWHFFAVSRLPV